MMRMLRIVALVVLALSLPGSSGALPVEPNLEELIKKFDEPRVDYPAARIGWDIQHEQVRNAGNPVYERMRWPWTPAGLRTQLISYATPDWRVWALFGLLIFTLRYYRYTKPLEQPRRAEVLPFPGEPARPAQAA
jgi:hypothetical protein